MTLFPKKKKKKELNLSPLNMVHFSDFPLMCQCNKNAAAWFPGLVREGNIISALLVLLLLKLSHLVVRNPRTHREVIYRQCTSWQPGLRSQSTTTSGIRYISEWTSANPSPSFQVFHPRSQTSWCRVSNPLQALFEFLTHRICEHH